MRKINLFFLSIVMSACVAGGGQPGWVSSPADKYAQSEYLTATGNASGVEDAKNAALTNLAKIFEVQIDETSRDEASAWQLSGEGEVLQGGSQLTARYIDAYTSKLLEGASVVETWQSQDKSQYFALAVLSRNQLSSKFKAEIKKADRFIKTMLARAKQNTEPFRSAQALYRGQSALQQREMLQRDLQIVDASGRGIPAAWSVKDFTAQIDQRLSAMKVVTDVLPGELNHLGSDLAAALPVAVTAVGMQYSAEAKEYLLQAKLDIEDQGQHDGWYWYRGALEVKLLVPAAGDVLASYRWPLKAPGQSKDQARIRLQDQVSKKLNTELKSALLSFGAVD